jgi:hypothetical protein
MKVKTVLFSIGLYALINGIFAADVEKEISSEILDDYNGIPIIEACVFNRDEEEVDIVSVSTMSIEERFRKKLGALDLANDLGKKFVLRYSTSALSDITFHELTEKLLVLLPTTEEGKKRFILNLSYNGLTDAISADLQRWVDHNAIAYVSINGNPNISKRNIKKICSSIAKLSCSDGDLEAKKGAVRKALSKVVFLPFYYITTAKRRVRIYKELEDKQYLPRDWDLIQKEYYRVIENASDFNFPEEDFRDPLDEAASADELD